jgi:hypothetical protein
MTIRVTEYFQTRKDDRKKETRYINVINKDSCDGLPCRLYL